MARKYQSYIIEIEYHNGDKERIDMFNSRKVNHENYTEMMRVYKEIKEQYKDKECNINFCGSSDDSCFDVLFTKVYKNKLDIDNEESESTKTLFEIASELETLMSEIKQRNQMLYDLEGAIDKKRDIIYHQAESAIDIPMTDEQKIVAFNTLIETQVTRRNLKNEITLKSSFDSCNTLNVLSKTIESINNKKAGINNAHKYGVLKYANGLNNEKLMKEVQWRTFKERMSLMKQLEPKYDKVVQDEQRHVLICYNRCK